MQVTLEQRPLVGGQLGVPLTGLSEGVLEIGMGFRAHGEVDVALEAGGVVGPVPEGKLLFGADVLT